MILITGANGQLGQDFQKYFTQQGLAYLATDYVATPHCVALDITDPAAVESFLDGKAIDLLINCAAYNDVDRAESEVAKAYALNCDAPKNLARIARQRGIPLVTYSTDFVFDGTKGAPYRETDPPNPLSVYGKAKYQGEQEALQAYDRVLVIRTSWVFGLGNNNFNKSVLRWVAGSDELRIVADQISAPTYSRDLAEYSWYLIRAGATGLYHLSNQGQASKYEQAAYLLRRIGWRGRLIKARTAEFKLPAPRPAFSKLDSSKAESLIGKKLPEWTDALDRFLDELKQAEKVK